MNNALQFEDRVSRSRSKHEGESSASLCDRPSRIRALSQRQLPTDHDYAVPTREYQTDQSSLSSDSAAAGPVLENINHHPTRAKVDRVTPYQPLGFFFVSWRKDIVHCWELSVDKHFMRGAP